MMDRRTFLTAAVLLATPLMGAATTTIDLGGRTRRASLLVAGSDEFHPYATKLTEAFSKANPQVDVLVEAGGTEPGLLAVKRGAIDVAMTSRELRAGEDDKLARAFLIARDAIALVVHPSNPVSDLTKAQAVSLLRGQARGWDAVGGSASPVHLLRRKAGAGTQKALEKLVLANQDMAPQAAVIDSGVKMREAVAADPQAFGFLALHDITDAVKVLAIGGVPMARTTVLSARYPYARSFFFVTHGKQSPTVEQFISYAQGPQGQAVVSDLGLIAVR